MARFAEIEGSRVVFVLPSKLAGEYPILVQNQVEIALDADVVQGDIYDAVTGTFRHITDDELKVAARPAFDAQRDALFAETQWVRQRHQDRVELLIGDKINWTAWLNYWQALRDMPAQIGFDASNPKFPEKPK